MQSSTQALQELSKILANFSSTRPSRIGRYRKHIRTKIEGYLEKGFSLGDPQQATGIPEMALKSRKIKKL